MKTTQVPVRQGLWSEPTADGTVHLLASKCKNCGEVFFPKKESGVCANCQFDQFWELALSSRGKIYSYSIVNIRPPGNYYRGEVPYALGYVDLPEGVRVETLFTECDVDDLHINMTVEMILDRLQEDDDGNEVLCYKFRPVRESREEPCER